MSESSLSGPLVFRTVGERTREFFEGMPVGRDLDYFMLLDDFEKVAQDQTNDWTVVKDTGATVANVADAVGGQLAITSTATTENDGGSIQGNEVFLPAASKVIWFETRVKIADADQQDIFLGICENFATDPEACLAAANRIGFQINDGDASILAKSEKATVESSEDTGEDAADATWVVLGFRVDGVSKIDFFVNRIFKKTITTNVPIVEMTPAAFSLSGNNTGTKSLTLDYIFCLATR